MLLIANSASRRRAFLAAREGVYSAAMMRAHTGNTSVRPAAVAGMFYPDDPDELRTMVSEFLRRAPQRAPSKALIVPHAGYIYSGSIAAAAYASVSGCKISRVVLVGPSHRVYLRGMALSSAQRFATPLGEIPIDHELSERALAREDVVRSDAPHVLEHCLEVQLPFLQMIYGEFSLLPVVLGIVPAAQVASLLSSVWGGEETLVLVSSDLSHYHDYATAQSIDAATNAAILRRDSTLSGDQACGAVGINGLMYLARERSLPVTEIARCNSGDTAGDRSRVVGYGAYAVA
jgi:AmmeMemoRadiSam system protein B